MSSDDTALWTGKTIIETERLLLRGFREADLAPFAQMHLDAEVMRYLGGVPLSSANSDSIAAGAQRSFNTTGVGKIAIERRSDGAFLGMAGLSFEDWYPEDLEVGWRLARPYWGHGYASEAGAAWLAYAFDKLGANRVISITDAPNRRSIAVMERIGMRLDHRAQLAEPGGHFEAVIYSVDTAGGGKIANGAGQRKR